ncbi:hypothetical protein [Nitrospirillum amazonense]|uniref:Uncharacterized protein n=1 Tax=Nitrospirillum amazonense TaxID=28077 RepID=A0A560JVY0_9PROT|nr:hypothetical protein [Nitrospirillum amazonense]MDG3440507.1 hypothetical protein [Nitrospirillum amazonense]TWB75157.1 hypothetical protein FBZ87_104257 [Nitrospirillum amazonense]
MSPFKRPSKPLSTKSKGAAPTSAPTSAGTAEVPSTLDDVLAAGARDGLRRDRGYARFRAQADKAAAAADKGDDRAYRLLAEAIRQLLNDRR